MDNPAAKAGTQWGMGVVAVVIALGVWLFAPAPSKGPVATSVPGQTTASVLATPVGCTGSVALCHAIALLEELRDDPTLTPAEREAVNTAAEGVDDVIRGAPDQPTTTTPPTVTSTTPAPPTTRPYQPDDVDVSDWVDVITDDPTLTTIPTTTTAVTGEPPGP